MINLVQVFRCPSPASRGPVWFIRIAIAVALVLVSYSPTGYSFYDWLSAPSAGITA